MFNVDFFLFELYGLLYSSVLFPAPNVISKFHPLAFNSFLFPFFCGPIIIWFIFTTLSPLAFLLFYTFFILCTSLQMVSFSHFSVYQNN